MKVAIIGGGAAGFFMAINLKSIAPDADITIYEKSEKVLAKVAVSGGGRCNLTNSFAGITDLLKAYPRGDKLLKRAFRTFDHEDAYSWFEGNGVALVTQDDECVFPRSQDAQMIIDCFLKLSRQLGISIRTSHTLSSLVSQGQYVLSFKEETAEDQIVDMVAVTTGGNSKEDAFAYLRELGHAIVPPVPSLFTFNIPGDPVRELMGTVAENAVVTLQGTKLKASGALLVTHWGMSGPAILRLSSYAARVVSESQYRFNILVNWVGETDCEQITGQLHALIGQNPQKLLANIRPYDLSSRLWLFLLRKAGISPERKWAELGTKGINKIMTVLSNDSYTVHGKGQFRDEFVTCGGVSLNSIDANTLESKHTRNLYFAGEVLDIDAVTGGFNLQAAWTTAYVAAQAMSARMHEGETEGR